ncbi:TAXI family TRAP transporter solute-binding subunit [Streptomyces sp. NPDC047072]|uniref:TAXI family TRAP transporter solute-binding subunit n=1 Tax=Streptomyces sp. NPDC047072 TaxID=3154809 RepID=UPI00340CD43F
MGQEVIMCPFNASPIRSAEPKIDRSLTLHLRGDWGSANLHRICGWITQELAGRSGPHTRIATWNGRGFVDAVRAVGRGEVHVALTTPAAFTVAALEGSGVYAGESYPDLRALGVIPRRARLVVAVHRDLGITTFAELRERKPVLRLATAVQDGAHHVGLAAHEVLTRSGVDITGWGGELLEDEYPSKSLDHVREGRANAIVHETIMQPDWLDISRHLNLLEIEEDVLGGLFDDFAWPATVVEGEYFPGRAAFRTLDFSDVLVLARADLPDDVGYAIAWVLGETRHTLESQYLHLAPECSPLTFPLDPRALGATPLPLHRGAARYYSALPGS